MRGGATEPERAVRAADVGEIEVFATGRSTLITADHDRPVDVGHLADQLHRVGTALHDGLEHARAVRAVPGHRPGRATPTPSTASRRRGGGCDIVRPIFLDPLRASAAAVSGRWLGHPVEHVELLDDSGADALLWHVAIIGDRRTPATLHLLASPSMVVTVIELIPHGRLRWHRGEVVRDGVAAADVLAVELVDATRE
jgi:hypothetical protein